MALTIRQVFLVQAFGDLSLVRRLIQDVAPHASLVLVHIDKKTRRRAFDSLAREFADYPSIRVLRERRVWHGGFSQVRTTLSLISLALETCDWAVSPSPARARVENRVGLVDPQEGNHRVRTRSSISSPSRSLLPIRGLPPRGLLPDNRRKPSWSQHRRFASLAISDGPDQRS